MNHHGAGGLVLQPVDQALGPHHPPAHLLVRQLPLLGPLEQFVAQPGDDAPRRAVAVVGAGVAPEVGDGLVGAPCL